MQQSSTPVWQQRWFQWALGTLVVLALVGLIAPPILALLYATRSVIVPVLIGVGLAYAANPLVRLAHERLRVPRPASAVLIIVILTLILSGLGLYVVPRLAGQLNGFYHNLPSYVDTAASYFEFDLPDAVDDWIESSRQGAGDEAGEGATPAAGTAASSSDQPAAPANAAREPGTSNVGDAPITENLISEATETVDWRTLGVMLAETFDLGLGVIGSAISFTTYLGLAAVVVCFVFVFFVWKFDEVLRWFVPFIPTDHRGRTLDLLGKMDRSVAAFIRGRMIQACALAVVLSFGWWLAGVPYWLLLGVAGGLLNLIPYAAVVSWPLAVLLAWLEATGGAGSGFAWQAIVWPTAVYMGGQLLDGWVVEPLVQGKATNLDPLTVLLAVLIGGALAGLLGLMLAIPVTACAKILAQEELLPRLRRWAERRPGSGKSPSAPPAPAPASEASGR